MTAGRLTMCVILSLAATAAGGCKLMSSRGGGTEYQSFAFRLLDGETGRPIGDAFIRAIEGQRLRTPGVTPFDKTDADGRAGLRLPARGATVAVRGPRLIDREVVLRREDLAGGSPVTLLAYRPPPAASVLEVSAGFRGIVRLERDRWHAWPVRLISHSGLREWNHDPTPNPVPPPWTPGQRVFVTRLDVTPGHVNRRAMPAEFRRAIPHVEVARFADGAPLAMRDVDEDDARDDEVALWCVGEAAAGGWLAWYVGTRGDALAAELRPGEVAVGGRGGREPPRIKPLLTTR